MTQPLRVGLAGAGWVTSHHLAGWRALEGQAAVVAIADPNIANAEARAREFGIARVFASAQEMLDAMPLDAVDVAAPREFHAAIVRAAAERGLAVLCQKPLAPTLAEARALADEVAPRCRLMVHENWRFRPCYRDLAGWLAEGRIGDVVQASMTLMTSGLLPDEAGRLPALERQPFIAGLERALVMEILIHHIDTLRFLLGELTLVHARLGRASPAMRGEDRAFLSFETMLQAPVALLANLSVHGRAPAQADRLTLVGTKGTIELENDTLRCLGAQPAELRYDLPACYLASYAATIAHFVEGVRNGRAFETEPADNLRTLALVEAVYRQQETASEAFLDRTRRIAD
ncbi:Gfo/Idh/MocA family protein [Variovorax paradoxus]|jgi:predicted dehydrogenase|uniref:Gfo/Idh/MocA family protein n=1 Tax=Variovorax paradoxus TaxID=34073 RepID=UPI0029C83ED8|nr:Gfo/Idh/MocA family oxidoreductase [Variovorax paradoxus]WPH24312.1 Gfo/Idh/MocA family oxidoreductase [Variovorax paradoxus]